MAKPKFNFIYNDNSKVGFGKGYYLFFQGIAQEDKGQPLFAKYYPLSETKFVDYVSVGMINDLEHYSYMGWEYDRHYIVDLTKEFKVHDKDNYDKNYITLYHSSTNEKVYDISYHYMHYNPSTIVKMLVPECLLERTKEVLSKDTNLLIDSIEEL